MGTRNTSDILVLPVWEVQNEVAFPFCRIYMDLRQYEDVERLSEIKNSDNKVFVTDPSRNSVRGMAFSSMSEQARALYEKSADPVIGTVCELRELGRRDDETFEAVLEGTCRAICFETEMKGRKKFARVAVLKEQNPGTGYETECCRVYARKIHQQLSQFAKAYLRAVGVRKNMKALDSIDDFATFSFCAADFAELDADINMDLLKCDRVPERLQKLVNYIHDELQFLDLSEKLLSEVQQNLSDQQKDVFLREQMRVIQHELGEDENAETDELEMRFFLMGRDIPEKTLDRIYKDLARLRKMSPLTQEYQVAKMHLEFLSELPWEKPKGKEISLENVRAVLNRDHYAMDSVKDRIVEYMAVKTMKKATVNTMLCLYGPPGTGKTSVAKSVAEALSRKFVRISLGGVHDEAEIRGHRKTYVGAMPGRILTAMKNAGTRNPVMLLDEIDKMCGDFRGDPASALLEVLDREQNKTFRDNYAEVPFDLSEVLFITTANTLETIPAPLRDRLEIIELSSYTEDEKFEIAKRHLVPRQIREHGLNKNTVTLSDGTIRMLIREYTQEAGVRNLERKIAALIRKSICVMREEGKKTYRVNEERARAMLGAGRAIHRFATGADRTEIGVVNGMAWTSVGGVLLSVEVNVLEGTGKLEITGMIGDVMKESAQAALSYIRLRAADFGIPHDFYRTKDIHLHVPEGATPKDGPSAGVTIATAMFSALTGIPIKQCVAMTGEITLRGEVLAIGGLKEKSLAALKEGISTILVPAENAADVAELPEAVKKGLRIIQVESVEEVLRYAVAEKRPVETGLADPARLAAAGRTIAGVPDSVIPGRPGTVLPNGIGDSHPAAPGASAGSRRE